MTFWQREDKCEDLIRLDSTTSPDLEDFDPLSKNRQSTTINATSQSPPSTFSSPEAPIFTKGLTNPLYKYYTPNSPINGNLKLVESFQSPQNTTQVTKQPNYENTLNDQHLLREYGIDFSNFSITRNNSQNSTANCDPFNNMNKKQQHWTTFD